MQNKANSIEQYISMIDSERQNTFQKLFQTVADSLDNQFQSGLQYGMPSFFVPHSLYPAGYHCDPKQPLPFVSVAAQKNFLSLYHLGMYALPDLMSWFTKEYTLLAGRKPDVGKSCIRFKKSDKIPFELIAELCKKMSASEWVEVYERQIKKV